MATRAHDLQQLLDMLTHQAQSELGDISQSLFFMGDGLQRSMVNGFFDLLRPATWSPVNLLRLGTDTVRGTMQLSRLLQPDQLNLAWQELRNKLEVFVLVKNLSNILHLPPHEFIPLPQLVEKAYSMPAFQALWAVEGLGHYYADIYWEQKGVPQGLLFEEQAPVPEKSLLMLHAGIGLAFADRLLGNLTSETSDAELGSVLEYFFTLCVNNCRKGYLGAAVESLGLVTRDFYPDFLQRNDRYIRATRPEFLGFFWHGVGRALYFSRQFFLPALRSVWSGVDEEAHNAADRLSAMAGLSWAVTMVNLRQPAIMANVVRSHIEDGPLADGFTNGVVSSLIMRTDTTPGETFITAFYQAQPDLRDQATATAWEKRITQPSRMGLETYYPALRRDHALDQVFRYQDLASLVAHPRQQ